MKLARVVRDYIALKQSMGSRFHTEATILKAFCKAVGDVSITDVEPQQAESYLAGTGPVTLYWHRKHEVLNGFYRFALVAMETRHQCTPWRARNTSISATETCAKIRCCVLNQVRNRSMCHW